MKRPTIIVLLAIGCLGQGLSAAEPDKQSKAEDKQANFERVLAEKPVVPEDVVYKKADADTNRKAFDKLWQMFVRRSHVRDR